MKTKKTYTVSMNFNDGAELYQKVKFKTKKTAVTFYNNLVESRTALGLFVIIKDW